MTGAEPTSDAWGRPGCSKHTRLDEVARVHRRGRGGRSARAQGRGCLSTRALPDRPRRVRGTAGRDPFAGSPSCGSPCRRAEDGPRCRSRTTTRPAAGRRGPCRSTARPTTRDRTDPEHIAAGDTYQVNYTLRLRRRRGGPTRAVRRPWLRAGGAYAGYMNTGRPRARRLARAVLPHRRRPIRTMPMKGTAPRGRWLAEDERARERLEGSAKDRAENAMIVDLLRNDMARSLEGERHVDDVFRLERYETVWQLTSTVDAKLAPDVDLVDVFRALFPGGSVTGAPKVRPWASSPSSMRPRRRLLRHGGYVAARAIGARGAIQRGDPHGDGRTPRRGARSTARGAASRGIRPRPRVRRDGRQGAGAHGPAAPLPPVRDAPPRLPGEGYRRLDEHPGRLRASAATSASQSTSDTLDAWIARRRGSRGEPRVRLVVDRAGRIDAGPPRWGTDEPVRLHRPRPPRRSRRPDALPQDDAARALRRRRRTPS